MRKKIIIVALVVLAIAIVFFINRVAINKEIDPKDEVSSIPTENPIDVTNAFYSDWLKARQSTTTDPITAGLAELPVLSSEVRAYILEAENTRLPNGQEVVLCQLETPDRIGTKILFQEELTAQVMVLARGGEAKSPFQAQVDLKAVGGKWQISKIHCSQGEVAPISEFSFDKEGYLLKSVPPPLDSNYWHLVYEENGKLGHTTPLDFDQSSICLAADGIESICDPATFIEPTLVQVQAEMLETGAVVKKLHFR